MAANYDVAIDPRVASQGRASGSDWAIRMVDIPLALIATLFLLPVFLLVAAIIFVSGPGTILFAHQRIGRNGKTFPCLKFRTMVMNAEERLNHILETDPQARLEWQLDRKLRKDPRVTLIGNFLRKSSIDELPQLFNVLRGEMSLVGPRPIVASERPLYGRAFSSYCNVRPGMTGLWQISGRNNVSYRRRVALDVMYTRRKSVAFDLRIIFMTVPAVLMSRGSY